MGSPIRCGISAWQAGTLRMSSADLFTAMATSAPQLCKHQEHLHSELAIGRLIGIWKIVHQVFPSIKLVQGASLTWIFILPPPPT